MASDTKNQQEKDDVVVVDGNVAEGFESVKDMFESIFSKGHLTKGQLCVYVKGEMVIDLCGKSGAHNKDYNQDSLQLLFRCVLTAFYYCAPGRKSVNFPTFSCAACSVYQL